MANDDTNDATPSDASSGSEAAAKAEATLPPPPPPAADAESTEDAPVKTGPSRRDLQIGGAIVVALLVIVGVFLIGRSAGSSKSSSNGANSAVAGEDQLSAALALHMAGKIDAAAKGYNAVLASDPNNTYALYNLGLIAQTRGDNQAALSYYDRSIKSDPEMMSAVYNRALVYRDLGRTQDAITALRKVVKADPKSVGGLYNLGVLLIAEGNVQEGTDLVNRAIELDPSLKRPN